jgi:hypothetical protein
VLVHAVDEGAVQVEEHPGPADPVAPTHPTSLTV